MDTIGWATFFGCKQLEKVVFWTSSIREISAFAFRYCKKLNSIVYNCTGTEKSCFPDFKLIKQFSFEWTSLTDVKLSKIERLWEGVFRNCDLLTHFSIIGKEHTITYMPRSLLKGCATLQEVELGINVESINEDCFKNCKNLKKLILRNDKKVINMSDEGSIFTDITNIPDIYVPNSLYDSYTSSKWGELYKNNIKKL